MPTYEYRCAKCGQHLEVSQSFSEAPLTVHDQCGGTLAKVLSAAGIVLKGSGFYRTDSRDSSRSKSKKRTEAKSGDATASKSGDATASKSGDSGSSTTSGSTDTGVQKSEGSAA